FSSRYLPHHFLDFVLIFRPVFRSITKIGFLYRLAMVHSSLRRSTGATLTRFSRRLKPNPDVAGSKYCSQYLSGFHGCPGFASPASLASSPPAWLRSASICIGLNTPCCDDADDEMEASSAASSSRRNVHERCFEVRSLSTTQPSLRRFGARRLSFP